MVLIGLLYKKVTIRNISNKRAHWGGKKYLDLLIEYLCDLLSLDFLRSGHKPVLRRPLIWSQDDSLKRLDPLEPVLLPNTITFLKHQVFDFVILAQSSKGLSIAHVDRLVFESLSKVGFVRNDDGDRLLGIYSSIDADIADEGA